MENWFIKLKEVAKTQYNFNEFSLSAMDPENWRDYYNRNFTPERALEVDLGLSEVLPLITTDEVALDSNDFDQWRNY